MKIVNTQYETLLVLGTSHVLGSQQFLSLGFPTVLSPSRGIRGCDSSKKAESRVMWGVQVLRSPNLFKKYYSPQEAENAVISLRNHPVDIHIFHNAHATIAWPQQTLL